MKNKKWIVGILITALACCFACVGCKDTPSDEGNKPVIDQPIEFPDVPPLVEDDDKKDEIPPEYELGDTDNENDSQWWTGGSGEPDDPKPDPKPEDGVVEGETLPY